jgi:8-oxo-dGTP diphosphatase
MPGQFLAGIAALLWHRATDRYLVLRRAADKDFSAGVWECVTGRVEQGESFEAALHREIREETGTTAQIEFFVGTSHFYRGEPIAANELLGLAYCCSIADPDAVRLCAEHSEMRWLSAAQALDLLTAPDPSTQWSRRLIEHATWLNANVPEALRHQARQHGFGLD